MNRLSGWGRSEERKERRKQRARTSEETGRGGEGRRGRGKGPPGPLPQSTLGSLRSLVYFRAFPPLGSLFTDSWRRTVDPFASPRNDRDRESRQRRCIGSEHNGKGILTVLVWVSTLRTFWYFRLPNLTTSPSGARSNCTLGEPAVCLNSFTAV